MSQIRIRSNPYFKKVGYEFYDENIGKYVEISYENKPNSKLVGEDLKSTFLAQNVNEILKAVYDTYFNKDEKIRIIFEGTNEELKKISEEAKSYEPNIDIEQGEAMLQDENGVLSTLIEVARHLDINSEITGDVYSKINELRIKITEHYNDIEKELNDTNAEFEKMLSDKNSDNSLLIQTIKVQNEMRINGIKGEKDDLKAIKEKYINEYVIDKKTLINEYDKFKDEALKEIKAKDASKEEKKETEEDAKEKDATIKEEQIEYKENAEIKKKDIKHLAKGILDAGADLSKKAINDNFRVKVAKGIGEFIKNASKNIKDDVDANGIADKKFMEYANKLYNNSFETFANEIKKNICDIMRERAISLKDDVFNSISQDATEDEKNTIKNAIDNLVLFDESNLEFVENVERKFKNLGVVVHLRGVPNIRGLRNEWSTEIKKYVDSTYAKFYEKKNVILDEWEERIIQELKNNIVNMNPKIKEQLEIIEKVNKKMRNLEAKFETAKVGKSTLDSAVSFENSNC